MSVVTSRLISLGNTLELAVIAEQDLPYLDLGSAGLRPLGDIVRIPEAGLFIQALERGSPLTTTSAEFKSLPNCATQTLATQWLNFALRIKGLERLITLTQQQLTLLKQQAEECGVLRTTATPSSLTGVSEPSTIETEMPSPVGFKTNYDSGEGVGGGTE